MVSFFSCLLYTSDKKAFVTHVDDVEWKEVGDGLRIKELLCEKTAGKTEFYFGVAELEAGKDIPLHRYNLAHCNYILEGEVWARLGLSLIHISESVFGVWAGSVSASVR